jgi:ABC-type polysaccharide/polyol phosphate export permease
MIYSGRGSALQRDPMAGRTVYTAVFREYTRVEYTRVEYTPMVCTPIVLWKNRSQGYNACMTFAKFVFRSHQYMHKEKNPRSKGSNRKHTKHR